MKIERMLTIIVMLLNRKRVTATELAEKFEVSVRTIYRDIETINSVGIPIISFPGIQGGFMVDEDYKVNHQILTHNNMYALLSVLEDINETVDDIELESSIEKLKNTIPHNDSNTIDFQMDQLVIEMQPYGHSDKEKSYIKIIRHAIRNRNIVTLDYRNFDNASSSRKIEPMSLIFKNYRWYLFSYCLLKKEYRIFRLSRISDIRTEKDSFTRRTMTYHDFMEEHNVNVDMISVVLKFSSSVKSRVEDVFNQDQIEELANGDFLVKATLPRQEWLYTLIFSFKEHVTVLEPLELRKDIISQIENMHKNYL